MSRPTSPLERELEVFVFSASSTASELASPCLKGHLLRWTPLPAVDSAQPVDCRADIVIVIADESRRLDSLVRTLTAMRLRPPVIVVTNNGDAKSILELTRAGILVLPPPVDAETLATAVQWIEQRDRDEVGILSSRYRLSPRETGVLRCAVSGMNSDEAASEHTCSRATIATYWNRIFKKTGVNSQRDVILLLLEAIRSTYWSRRT